MPAAAGTSSSRRRSASALDGPRRGRSCRRRLRVTTTEGASPAASASSSPGSPGEARPAAGAGGAGLLPCGQCGYLARSSLGLSMHVTQAHRPRLRVRAGPRACPEAALYHRLRLLEPEARRALLRRFSEAQRLALERWIVSQAWPAAPPERRARGGAALRGRLPEASPHEPPAVRRRGAGGERRVEPGIVCRRLHGRLLFAARGSVGPFRLFTRFAPDPEAAARHRDAVAEICRRAGAAAAGGDGEPRAAADGGAPGVRGGGAEALAAAFARALVEEPARRGLDASPGGMGLCFAVVVSAGYWVGRQLVSPRFAAAEVQAGLRAWARLRRARGLVYAGATNRYSILRRHTPRQLEAAWRALRRAYLDSWAEAGKDVGQAKATLQVLEERHEAHRRRLEARWLAGLASAAAGRRGAGAPAAGAAGSAARRRAAGAARQVERLLAQWSRRHRRRSPKSAGALHVGSSRGPGLPARFVPAGREAAVSGAKGGCTETRAAFSLAREATMRCAALGQPPCCRGDDSAQRRPEWPQLRGFGVERAAIMLTAACTAAAHGRSRTLIKQSRGRECVKDYTCGRDGRALNLVFLVVQLGCRRTEAMTFSHLQRARERTSQRTAEALDGARAGLAQTHLVDREPMASRIVLAVPSREEACAHGHRSARHRLVCGQLSALALTSALPDQFDRNASLQYHQQAITHALAPQQSQKQLPCQLVFPDDTMAIGSPAVARNALFPTERDGTQETEEERQRRLLQNEPIVVGRGQAAGSDLWSAACDLGEALLSGVAAHFPDAIERVQLGRPTEPAIHVRFRCALKGEFATRSRIGGELHLGPQVGFELRPAEDLGRGRGRAAGARAGDAPAGGECTAMRARMLRELGEDRPIPPRWWEDHMHEFPPETSKMRRIYESFLGLKTAPLPRWAREKGIWGYINAVPEAYRTFELRRDPRAPGGISLSLALEPASTPEEEAGQALIRGFCQESPAQRPRRGAEARRLFHELSGHDPRAAHGRLRRLSEEDSQAVHRRADVGPRRGLLDAVGRHLALR
ncbi:unnamed protein product [Prorocentrum cordatum]|uniref:Uncharacterized protein n=1 Tax=Prorocentrum cordatum TaxID=2364126 RepID=A0ABN9UPL8_9DINO|nr:unnamed protein product [Polarella glacialis]